ncbi:MAG: restriction endonuclease [Thaumarchaeota archaeon]|nr:restriction endonuclease [Nitrososphaerota archaeon]
MIDLFATLYRLAGSREKAARLVESTAEEVGVPVDYGSRALVAMALCRRGSRPEEVSASLGWTEFESFCSKLLVTSGYVVEENVVLKKPRAQIDLVAFGPSLTLSVDCKHWKREHPPSTLKLIAAKQLRRSELLRRRFPDARPIASAILSFSASQGGFVNGVAVVPIRTLRSFLGSVESYSELLRYA